MNDTHTPRADQCCCRSKVCSIHFDKDCFQESLLSNRLILRKDAVPTIFPEFSKHEQEETVRNFVSAGTAGHEDPTVTCLASTGLPNHSAATDAAYCNSAEACCWQVTSGTIQCQIRKLRQEMRRCATDARSRKLWRRQRLKRLDTRQKRVAWLESEILLQVEQVANAARRGCERAALLLEQVRLYGQNTLCFSEKTVRKCLPWRASSPAGYEHARRAGIITLPTSWILLRHLGPSPLAVQLQRES